MRANSADNPKAPRETRDKMFAELKEASKPLIDFLYKYYHPHATIMVTQANVVVVEDDMGCPNELRD